MLEIEGLHFRYPGAAAAALEDVSLAAGRGRILGLLGPNGAGKSTLVAHLSGLLAVQQGEIRVDGVPLPAARRRDPTRIAVAPQEYAFYPMLSVAENLACFAAASRLSGPGKKAAIDRALASTQLESFAASRAERLSGGLKRRLNLAIALLPSPDLLVLDEPTVGVDPQSRAFLLDTVKSLAAAGKAVIYTSHYMEEIEAIADDVAIVDHGRLLRWGTLDSLLAQGATHLEATLAGPLPAAAAASLASLGTLQAEGLRLRLELHAGVSPVAALAAVEGAGAPVREARFGRYNLEQLFMQLTDRRLRDH